MSTEPDKKPHTSNLNDLELNILEYWDQEKMFERSLKEREGQPPFIFYDGPPFATGLPREASKRLIESCNAMLLALRDVSVWLMFA